MDSRALAPALSRDSFVANALWVGVELACQARLCDSDLNFRGNFHRGTISCNDGQGDSFKVTWDDVGVVVRIYELGERAVEAPPAPNALGAIMQQALMNSLSVTRWLWICGDTASPRLPPSDERSVFVLVEAFCGPSLVTNDEQYTLEMGLFDAILREQDLTEPLVAALLQGPVADLARQGQFALVDNARLEAARVLAENLGRFGLNWPNLARDVGPSESGD